MQRKDEVGNRYGKLTVVAFSHSAGPKGRKNAFWLCACDCGTTTVVKGTNLRRGKTTSCGCVKRDYFGATHGYSDSEPLYGVWEQMRSRCNNPNNKRYKNYGALGVTVCTEWSDYGAFREWAFANGYEPAAAGAKRGERLSIDRIDPTEGYSPDNCRWVTVSDNIRYMHECHANQR